MYESKFKGKAQKLKVKTVKSSSPQYWFSYATPFSVYIREISALIYPICYGCEKMYYTIVYWSV